MLAQHSSVRAWTVCSVWLAASVALAQPVMIGEPVNPAINEGGLRSAPQLYRAGDGIVLFEPGWLVTQRLDASLNPLGPPTPMTDPVVSSDYAQTLVAAGANVFLVRGISDALYRLSYADPSHSDVAAVDRAVNVAFSGDNALVHEGTDVRWWAAGQSWSDAIVVTGPVDVSLGGVACGASQCVLFGGNRVQPIDVTGTPLASEPIQVVSSRSTLGAVFAMGDGWALLSSDEHLRFYDHDWLPTGIAAAQRGQPEHILTNPLGRK
jgi:hypothetical protein